MYDGYRLSQPRICRKCQKRICAIFLETKNKKQDIICCPEGLSCVILKWEIGCFVCNGLLITGTGENYSPVMRKQYKSQKTHWDEIETWNKAVKALIPVIRKEIDDSARELVLGLHDVSTAVSLVTRNAEAIIDEYPGESDYEKIEKSPDNLKRLLKSVSLLRTHLAMSSIVANPESASFGQKHPTPIYKLFDRMIRLFEEIAAQKNIKIEIVGPSHARPNCFDSFDTLTLVLIDNAVKYSLKGHTIKVIVKDKKNGNVKVMVESYGPIVPKEQRVAIFDRGIRTDASEEFSSKGSGLGLFIARVVAEAHDFEIQYNAVEGDRSPNQGWNQFIFEIS